MPEREITITAAFTFRLDDPDTARNRLSLYTVGIPDCRSMKIVGMSGQSVRTWEDDIADAGPWEDNIAAPDRDDNRPVTEDELLAGYGAEIDEVVRSRRVPHALRRDVEGGEAA